MYIDDDSEDLIIETEFSHYEMIESKLKQKHLSHKENLEAKKIFKKNAEILYYWTWKKI